MKYLHASHQEWQDDVQGLIGAVSEGHVALAELGGPSNTLFKQSVTKKGGKVVSATLENKCAAHTHAGYSQARTFFKMLMLVGCGGACRVGLTPDPDIATLRIPKH